MYPTTWRHSFTTHLLKKIDIRVYHPASPVGAVCNACPMLIFRSVCCMLPDFN
jgi:hypothetical protein